MTAHLTEVRCSKKKPQNSNCLRQNPSSLRSHSKPQKLVSDYLPSEQGADRQSLASEPDPSGLQSELCRLVAM